MIFFRSAQSAEQPNPPAGMSILLPTATEIVAFRRGYIPNGL
jgi:hypothetical protein